ncbi:MAG: GNAT family N-acetyltransferase [Acidobacteriota bacterium]
MNLPEYEIRLATSEDVLFLQDIESAAGDLFLQFEFTAHLAADSTPLEDFYEALKDNLLWLAVSSGGHPIGFALVYMLEGAAHLEELAVHPDYGRRGIGEKLVQAVIDWARSGKISAVTLTTFRDIPWNAPFYQKLGFRILEADELTPNLVRIVDDEEKRGLARELRVVMRRIA